MLSEAEFNTWVEALESGKYKQGKGCLRKIDNSFCCLGVAADTLGFPWAIDTEEKAYRAVVNGSEKVSFLPFYLIDSEVQQTLANKNDSGETFQQIAQYLRKHKDAIVEAV